MNWLTRLLISNWTLVLMPIVLLGVWLSGVWVGESRTQRACDAERHQVAIVQARAEQKSADIKRSQEQINHEISNEFNQLSVQLAADLQYGGSVRLFCNTSGNVERLPAVPPAPAAVAQAAADTVPASFEDDGRLNCGRLAEDSAQTTLMVIEIQRWYARQAEIQGYLNQ